jgi:ABC-type polysaccharide/polyol phosphate export permease
VTAGAALDLRGPRTPPWRVAASVVRESSLLRLLAAQDYRARYRSTSLGLAWSVGLPLVQGVVIAVVFSHLIGGGHPSRYVPYVLAGMAAWSYLQQSLSAASTAIVDSAAIAGRIYFPRLLLPLVPATANLLGLAAALAVAVVVTAAVGGGIHLTLLLAPVAMLLAWVLVGVAGGLAAIAHVYSRDVRFIVQAGLLVLFYATPIIYALHASSGTRALPSGLRPLVLANPATGIVELTRLAILGRADSVGLAVAVTVGWAVLLAVGCLVAYGRLDRIAADRL